MKKLIMVVLAVFLMSGIASAATKVDINGYIRVYPELNNYGYFPGGKVPSAAPGGSTNSGTHVFTDQRAFLRLNVKSDENVGGTVAFEMDSRWGNNAYIDGRGQGGALGADTTNVEVKLAHLWFQSGALKSTVGIQTYGGDQTMLIDGGDMAGLQLDYALSKTSAVHTGAFTWYDQDTRRTDAVYFVPLTVTTALGSGNASAFMYTVQDQSNYQTLGSSLEKGTRPIMNTSSTTAMLTPQTGAPLPTAATALRQASYDKAGIYWAGLNYAGKAGNVSYYLMGAYNFGTFKNVIAVANGPVVGDAKISAIAANAKVDVKLGPGNLRFQALYAQGGGDAAADKFRGWVNGALYTGAQCNPLNQTDLVMLLSGIEIISGAQSFVDNPNMNGDGVQLAYIAYNHNLTPALSAQATLGYAQADKLDSASTRKGKEIGTEGNIHLRYKFSPNLEIAGVGAYTKVGDYNKAKVTPAAGDPDDTYRLLLKFKYSF